ncbi:HNH endonuclease [Cryobacterium sp. 1639]|uniref:HNH endonuclease signature motif containing protein n=1 Tax=Cryobacterium inferilacus TaxID=2866629 RepID=UPI001C73C974|nr:HNH endonuclease signature motif containing protein [Cryobacterium sp. 1639]MBX0298563.1 HNH endonuclease [Cryobacterium sp. 1639]
MSSPAEQFPDDPDDRPGDPNASAREQAHRRRRSLQEQARATLAKKMARVAKSHRKIARATAQRARDLDDLRQWSSDPVTAKLLNPDYARDGAAGPVLTDADASPRKVPAWEDQEIARRTVISEVACSLHLADRTAENLIGEAAIFAGPMTATLKLMSTGDLSYRHGQVLMEQLSFLPLEEVAVLEAQLLPVATELTVGKLAGRARRMRERAHPETITKRATEAVKERGVWWEGRPDGMGTLTWYGTAQQTQAAHDRLTSIAEATRSREYQDESIPEDQRRTIGQICADAIGDLLLDGVTPTGTGGGIRGSVMVTVPVLTAMGKIDAPGFLEGYGPIPADAAREIAGGAPSWTRLLTQPETGVVLSVGKEQYKVPADLRRWLRLRDGTCRFPGCTRPAARSHIDHTRPWEDGGPTDYDNLAHLCAAHHRLKHQSLWNVKQEPGGVLVWTSPAGEIHRTYPETALGPPVTQAPVPEAPASSAAPRPSNLPEQPPF